MVRNKLLSPWPLFSFKFNRSCKGRDVFQPTASNAPPIFGPQNSYKFHCQWSYGGLLVDGTVKTKYVISLVWLSGCAKDSLYYAVDSFIILMCKFSLIIPSLLPHLHLRHSTPSLPICTMDKHWTDGTFIAVSKCRSYVRVGTCLRSVLVSRSTGLHCGCNLHCRLRHRLSCWSCGSYRLVLCCGCCMCWVSMNGRSYLGVVK